MAPALTPAEESAARLQQAEIQRKDAAERRVAWDAEDESLKSDATEKERIESAVFQLLHLHLSNSQDRRESRHRIAENGSP